ncbi:MAG: AAA family ATPase [Planctomycetes bacterium]|nr:AAA family ATPase [Planctomycetota bacterium]
MAGMLGSEERARRQDVGVRDSDDGAIRCSALPCLEFAQLEAKLVLPPAIEGPLTRYVALHELRRRRWLSDAGLGGVLILAGPPGVGKTMTAGAVAQRMGKDFAREAGGQAVHVSLNLPALVSDMLGETAKRVAAAFRSIAVSAAQTLTVVTIDEMESLFFDRARLPPNDPTDLIRAVNELLKQLDRLRTCPNLLCIGTTNLLGRIDRALVDRADLVLHFPCPDVPTGTAILAQAARAAERLDIHVCHEEVRAAAERLCLRNKTISGRVLARLPLIAHLETGATDLRARDLVATARRMLDGGNKYDNV